MPELDLQYFLCNKNERNVKEHLAVLSSACELYGVFYNLYKIIRLLKPEVDVGLPSAPTSFFDWDIFDERMNCFDATQHRFILIATSSIHNISAECQSRLLRIHWSAIIDFDGTSDMGGLKTAIDESGVSFEPKALTDFNNVNIYHMLTNRPFYINLFTAENFGKNISALSKSTWSDSRPLDKLMGNVLCSTNFQQATVVILGEPNARTNDICTKVRNAFDKTNIICITEQTEFPIPLVPTDDPNNDECDDVSAQIHIVTDSRHICCDLINFFESLEAHEHLLPNKEIQISLGDGYRMPVTGEGKTQVISDKDILIIMEVTFEFLHTNLCGDGYTRAEKDRFLRGGIVSWGNILNGDAVNLIEPEKLQQFEKSIIGGVEKRTRENRRFYLEHEPGFGGTTLGRIIAWDLHKKIPVVVLKHCNDINDLTEKLRFLYSNMLNNSSYLVLIDEDIFSGTLMSEIEKLFERMDVPVYGLFVRRKTNDINLRGSTLTLCSFAKNIKMLLRMKCQELPNDDTIIEKRWKTMSRDLNERNICPLLINLHLLVEDFTLENYVARFLEKIPKDDINGRAKRTALSYLAMCHYYGNLSFPASMVNDIIGCVRKGDDIAEQNLDVAMGLLIKTKSFDNTLGFRTRHYQIAEEMLRQLISTENPSLALPLSNCSNCFIDFLCGKCRNNYVDPTIQEIITNLFTDKTAGRNMVNTNADCTLLLNSMAPVERFYTIDYLAKVFGNYIEKNIEKTYENISEYQFLAHIYAQCANVGSDEGEPYDVILTYCSKAEDIISSFHLQDYGLSHIIGMCHLKHVESLTDKDCLDQIFVDLKKAITCFDNSIIYGSPSYGIPMKLRAVTIFLNRIIEHLDIRDKVYETLIENACACEFLTYGYAAVQEMEDYDLTPIGESFAIQYRDEFYICCFPDNPSRALEQLNALLVSIDKGDFSGRLAVTSGIIHNYQRKYYNKDNHRNDLLIRAYTGKDKNAEKDAKKVFDHLNNLVQGGYHLSNALYKMWFNYSKFAEVSLKTGMDVALRWKNSVNEATISDETGLLWASYYLYVITMLLYVNDGVGIADDIENRRQELKQCLGYNRQNSTIRDWMSNGRGMGTLVSSTVIDIADVIKDARIKIFEGAANIVGEREGYLIVENLPRMSQIGKPSIGSSINKNMCVFFSPGACGILKEQATSSKKWKFKFGFSFERMSVSQNSLVDLNSSNARVESTVEKAGDVLDLHEVPIKNGSTLSLDHLVGAEAIFIPTNLFVDRYDTTKVFLNGNIGKQRAGLSIKDIEKYRDELTQMNISASEAINRLAKLTSIGVQIISINSKNDYIISLNVTGQCLRNLIPNDDTRASVAVVAKADEKIIKHTSNSAYVNLIGVEVSFNACEKNSKGGLTGVFKANGDTRKGTISSGISSKEIKHILLKKQPIKAKVIDQSPKGYTLKKL